MPFPKPDPSSRAFLEEILPPDPSVELEPMFGNTAGFVNGHMFAGTFGSDIVVRLPEAERTRLLAEPGAAIFAPMAGRVMREYVVLPRAWRDAPEKALPWTASALTFASQMPPKPAKTKAAPKAGKKAASKTRAPRE